MIADALLQNRSQAICIQYADSEYLNVPGTILLHSMDTDAFQITTNTMSKLGSVSTGGWKPIIIPPEQCSCLGYWIYLVHLRVRLSVCQSVCL